MIGSIPLRAACHGRRDPPAVRGATIVRSIRHGNSGRRATRSRPHRGPVDPGRLEAPAAIRADLGFSQQNLQWVLSGYLVTYGGFLLLGGRAADLVGRRLLVAGTALFAVCSLAGGLATNAATNAATLVGARLA
jgi:hypothetical protein